MSSDTFSSMWAELAPIGRAADGGYHRFAWTDVDRQLRDWFTGHAERRGLRLEEDVNGNLWAWHSAPGPGGSAVITGSHLDSVPAGGAYDGPLGVVAALLAYDRLLATGAAFERPFGIGVFIEEEGSRFGVACLGSRLSTGQISAERALGLSDSSGITLEQAMLDAGRDPRAVGIDQDRIGSIGAFVELHIEQGAQLIHSGHAVGLAESIWPHGRFRFDFTGTADHAGTTHMSDRHDPMLPYAHTVIAAHRIIGADDRATFGRLEVIPNGTNAIPSRVTAWLDVRCSSDEKVRDFVTSLTEKAEAFAAENSISVTVTEESFSGSVGFSQPLTAAINSALPQQLPILPTQAGHDAGILASAGVPAAMIFVRNPTGTSHSPVESASEEDALAGIDVLTEALRALLASPETA